MNDRYIGLPTRMTDPAHDADEITPNDNAELPGGLSRAIYVGEPGNLSVMLGNGKVVTFMNASAGYHPIRAIRVMAATDAGGIVAIY